MKVKLNLGNFNLCHINNVFDASIPIAPVCLNVLFTVPETKWPGSSLILLYIEFHVMWFSAHLNWKQCLVSLQFWILTFTLLSFPQSCLMHFQFKIAFHSDVNSSLGVIISTLIVFLCAFSLFLTHTFMAIFTFILFCFWKKEKMVLVVNSKGEPDSYMPWLTTKS